MINKSNFGFVVKQGWKICYAALNSFCNSILVIANSCVWLSCACSSVFNSAFVRPSRGLTPPCSHASPLKHKLLTCFNWNYSAAVAVEDIIKHVTLCFTSYTWVVSQPPPPPDLISLKLLHWSITNKETNSVFNCSP